MSKPPFQMSRHDSLDELVESQTQELIEILARPHTVEELKSHVSTLNDLLYSYSRRTELLQGLADENTPEDRRERIREALKAAYVQSVENREKMSQLLARSSQIIKKTNELIAKAQQQIDREAHKHTGYGLEVCGLCKGTGVCDGGPCAPCKGSGGVLVHQPALKCPRCDGSGKASPKDSFAYYSLCIVCRGTGWALSSPE